MVDAKRWLTAPALAALAGIALSGCEASQDGDYKNFPKPAETFTAQFAPTAAIPTLPFPIDLFFGGTKDGTLEIPATYSPMTIAPAALNTLDGFSTSASMITRFNLPIDGSSLSGTSVRLVELYLSNSNKGPAQGAELPPGVTSPVKRVLAYGSDYKAVVSAAVDSNGQTLEITPLKPLTPSTGTTNIGYLVLITNGVKDVNGSSAQQSADYAAIKAAPADCSTFSPTTQALAYGACRFAKWQLTIAQGLGVNPADVVLSWSFSTQSTEDTIKALAATVPAQAIAAQPTGLTTKQASAALAGKANIYVGTTVVPYYSKKPANANDASVLSSFWVSATPPPAAFFPNATAPHFITRFNPVPVAQGGNTTIPLLVTVPNATANAANGGCTKPAAGWPVVIFMHGFLQKRTDALGVADGYADACFVVAAIDYPLHGITDTTSPFYQATNERTFNLDLINNTTNASGPDGKIDGSGVHLLNAVVGSPLMGRDALRQGIADVGVLAKSLASLDLTGDAVSDIDGTRVHYIGMSFGAILGAAQAKYNPNVRTVALSAPGGTWTKIMLESPYYSPQVRSRVMETFAKNPATVSFPENGASFLQLFRELQTVVDPGDPFNHICNCAGAKPLFMQKIKGDTVVPNSTTDVLINAVNATKLKSGVNPVAAGQPAYVTLTVGSHGSIIDPSTSAAATVELQTQAVKFATSATQAGGPFLVITNPAIVEQ
jgi:pimeloyl-ACP methyl ester carboxylesterase